MYLGSRQISCLTDSYCKRQGSNSLLLNYCNRTIQSFWNSNTCKGLANFLALASCKIILQAKPISAFFGDKVFFQKFLLRTSILESLAAVVASSRTDFSPKVLTKLCIALLRNFFRKDVKTFKFGMVTKI